MSNSLPRQPAMPAVSHGTLPAKLDGTYTYTYMHMDMMYVMS